MERRYDNVVMIKAASSRFPRWLTAVFMFVITFVLTTLTYFIDIVAALYYYITILAVLCLWLYVDRQPPEGLGFRFEHRWWLQITLGIFLAGIVLGLIIWFETLVGWVALTPSFLSQPLGLVIGFFAVYAVNQAVITTSEELVSRGYIQQNLGTSLSIPATIFISAFMFALFHIPAIIYLMLTPIFAIIMFCNVFLGGVVLGLAFARTQNLWLSIGLHFGWNTMLYHIVGIRGDGVFQYQSLASEIFTGGTTGPEAGILGTIGFLFLIIIIWICTKEVDGQLLRTFEPKPLLMFAAGFLVILIPVVLGLLLAGMWIFLVIWIVYAIFFLQIWENRILCSHCPYYGSEGRTLRCHANYGLYKLWKYNPAPMSRLEQAQMVVGVAIMLGFPFPFLFWGQQWLYLIFASFGAIVLGAILFGWLCLRCVNFSCPFNRVPKKEIYAFLKEHPEMRKAWRRKRYKGT
ncbi:MAG: lysostaphin resistance A-like protein [Promethearchaeota archaeon]